VAQATMNVMETELNPRKVESTNKGDAISEKVSYFGSCDSQFAGYLKLLRYSSNIFLCSII